MTRAISHEMQSRETVNDDTPREVPVEIEQHRAIWVRLNRRWRAIHYYLGGVATVCAITVASQPKVLGKVPMLLDSAAWVSAVCIALMTFLVPFRRAKGYVSAARLLTDACNRYRLDPSFKMKNLLDALREGEDLVSKGEEL